MEQIQTKHNDAQTSLQLTQTPEMEARVRAHKELRQAVKDSGLLWVSLLLFPLAAMLVYMILFFSPGVGMTAVGLTMEGLLFYLTRKRNAEEADKRRARFLSVPFVLIACSFSLFVRSIGGNFLVWTAMGLFGVQMVLLTGRRAQPFFSAAMLKEVLLRTFLRPFAELDLYFLPFAKSKRTDAKKRPAVLLLLGVLLSVPLLLVLTGLFSSADSVFSSGVTDFFEVILEFLRLDTKAMMTLVLAIPTSVLIGAALYQNTFQKEAEPIKQRSPRELPTLVGVGFLTALNALLLWFVVIQMRFLFLKEASRVIFEFGYAAYARQGFFELVFASLFIFAASAALTTLCKGKAGSLPLSIKLLVALTCLLDLVIAVSAVQRLWMYMEALGLTARRLAACFIIAAIAVSLIWLLLSLFVKKLSPQKWIALSLLVLVTLFSLTNIDGISARYNADLYLSGQVEPDYWYFTWPTSRGTEFSRLYEATQDGRLPKDDMEDVKMAMNWQLGQFHKRSPLSYTLGDFTFKKAITPLEQAGVLTPNLTSFYD